LKEFPNHLIVDKGVKPPIGFSQIFSKKTASGVSYIQPKAIRLAGMAIRLAP
jgi:hypothetical protein